MIEQVVPVTVYGKSGCPQCKQTTKYLTKHGVPHTYLDVTEDEAYARVCTVLGYQALPVVTAGDMHWSGFRYEKLARLADIHAAATDVAGLDRVAEQFLAGEVL